MDTRGPCGAEQTFSTMTRAKYTSIGYMVTAVFCFAIVNTMAKLCDNIPVHELILFRATLSFSFCWWYLRRHKISMWGNNKFWLIMRSVMGLVALVLFFLTIKHMPLASASTIQYLSPIFTVLIAVYLNNQKVRRVQWLYFSLALAGTVMIKGFDERVSTSWLLVGIVSAFFAGLAYNAIIRSKGTDHPMVIVMYVPLVALPVMGTWSAFHWVTPQGWQWLYLFIMGVFAQIAQYFTTIALHSDAASKVTPWTYTGAIFAITIGYLFFDEGVNAWSIAGMLLVIAGVVLNARVRIAHH
jgi:drug/metabolite transporter (DMT)-like permease